MATAEEALEKMREICLALPESREKVHFGQAAFHVMGKLFATCGDKRGVWEISFGLEADHAAALAEKNPLYSVHPRDKRGVVVDVAKVTSWAEIKALILESYELLKAEETAKKPARKRSTR